MKVIKTVSLVILTTFTFFISYCFGVDSKPLTKPQATELLQIMGYQAVEVGAIVQQFGHVAGAQNVTTVIAIGTEKGETRKIERQFFYDSEVGWFTYHFDDDRSPTKLQIWTLSGYKELRPKLTDSSASEKIIGFWENHDNDGSDMVLNYTMDGRWQQTIEKKKIVLSGTWKIEQGVVIATILASTLEQAPSGTIRRWKILILDQSQLALQGTGLELFIKGENEMEKIVKLERKVE